MHITISKQVRTGSAILTEFHGLIEFSGVLLTLKAFGKVGDYYSGKYNNKLNHKHNKSKLYFHNYRNKKQSQQFIIIYAYP